MIKLPLSNKKRFTGLEIEGGFIKLAQAIDSAGTRKIIKLIVKKSASQSEKDIVEALKDALGELKGQVGHLTVSIPRHKATVRLLSFPSVNEKEIAGMVGLQAAKELPFSKEEIISDYLITERTKDGYAKVVLIIVHQDVINGYLDILKKAGLQPERITLSTEALLSWSEQALRQERQQGCSLFIDPDCDNTDIVILYNSHLGFTRGLNVGTSRLQQRPELKNKLAEEIRHTMNGYSRQERIKIENVLLGPSGEGIEGLKDFLEGEFNLPCQILSPLKNLTCEKGISALQYKSATSLLRVLGMALDIKRRKLNFLPPVLREKQRLKSRRKRLYTTVALLLGIIFLSWGIFAKKIHDKQLRISYLDREIKKTHPLAEEVENMLKKIELIERRRKIEGSSVDILREIHKVVPGDISLSSFTYDEQDETATFQGVSASMSVIFKFINTLEESAHFKNVQLKYVSEKKTKPAGLTDFKIECALE